MVNAWGRCHAPYRYPLPRKQKLVPENINTRERCIRRLSWQVKLAYVVIRILRKPVLVRNVLQRRIIVFSYKYYP